MPRPSNRALRFVRTLAAGAVARRKGEVFAAEVEGRTATLEAPEVRELVGAGVLSGDDRSCRAGDGTRSWLRRALAETDEHAAQHRMAATKPTGETINLAESPLARLAAPGGDGSAPFLTAHQVEAGERVRRLVERAHLQPRLTMSYDPSNTASGRRGQGAVADLTETAAAARRALDRIAGVLPRDCHAAVIDVCGFLKGLQVVESERGWPRRSAKLVLRIGLDQLARHFGLEPEATGIETRRRRAWMDDGARPTQFG